VKKERKLGRLYVRLTLEDKEVLKAVSERMGMTITDFIRQSSVYNAKLLLDGADEKSDIKEKWLDMLNTKG
jgi:hypothetical protein